MKNVKIQLASSNNIDDILTILEQRCIWMEKNNINQWQSNSYTITFNKAYFEEQIENKTVYIANINQKVCGLFLLKDSDPLWEDLEKAFYIHHLATDMQHKGLGKIMIEYIKSIAINYEKTYLRLDCVKDNLKLNQYYENLGFVLKKSGTIRTYNYNLRELKI